MAPKIYTSPYPSMPLVKTSIFHYSFPTPTCESAKLPHARLSPELPAFVDAATGRVVSRRQLKSDALRLSLGLRTNQELGLNKGDVIMLFSVNSIDYPSVLYGGQAGGFITTLANSGYTPQEVKHQLEDSGAKVVFVHPSLLPVLSGTIDLLKQKSKPIPKVYFLARETDLPAEAGNTGIQSYENLMVDEEKVKQANWVGEKVEGNAVHQTAVLCYSSGTTGLSKGESRLKYRKPVGRLDVLLVLTGVESTHYNLTSVQTMLTHPGPYPSLSPKNNDKIVGVLPFYRESGKRAQGHAADQGV
jgi:acyl-CoA synthetase (AMP-forming)/AMP-acid ligase II